VETGLGQSGFSLQSQAALSPCSSDGAQHQKFPYSRLDMAVEVHTAGKPGTSTPTERELPGRETPRQGVGLCTTPLSLACGNRSGNFPAGLFPRLLPSSSYSPQRTCTSHDFNCHPSTQEAVPNSRLREGEAPLCFENIAAAYLQFFSISLPLQRLC